MDKSKIEQLLEEGNLAGAQSEVENILSGELSESEQGEVLIWFAKACIDAENALNREYLAALREGIATLEHVNHGEAEKSKAGILDDLRKDILGK